MNSIDQDIPSTIRAMVSPRRYGHIEGVADTAAALAVRFGESEGKARLAGYLHDAMRGKSDEELLALAKGYGVAIDPYMQQHASLLHGPLAAEFARREFGVDDEAVIEAIKAHTVGDAVMEKLTCILYLADAMEPSREYEGVEELRELAKKSLYRATLLAMRQSEAYLIEKGQKPHPVFILAVRALNKHIEEEIASDTKREGTSPVHC